ncbi:cytochrome c biogenesis protein CcsA [Puniceicoccaceae bacterium K14]|nr:cytochrome c biogenesis protein CcsA [Puniceicoccaceae bacterium K14]
MNFFETLKYSALAVSLLFVYNSHATENEARDIEEAVADSLGSLAIQDQGRIKPLDTFARASLLAFQSKSTFEHNPYRSSYERPDKSPAIWWLTRLMLDPQTAYEQKVFKIRTDEVVQSMSIPVDADEQLYSFKELGEGLNRISGTLQAINEKEPNERSRVEKQLLDLFFKTGQYLDISRSLTGVIADIDVGSDVLLEELGFEPGQKLSYFDVIQKKALIGEKLMAWSKLGDEEKRSPEGVALSNLARVLQSKMQDLSSRSFRVIPPDADHRNEDWSTPWGMLDGHTLNEWELSRMEGLKEIVALAQAGDVEGVAQKVDAYNAESYLESSIGLEVFFNKSDFFYRSLYIYILSCLLLWFSFIGFSKWLSRLSFASLAFATGLQAVGIVVRCLILGRPPVTNLYESIIFVCGIISLSSVVLEIFWRKNIAIFVGGISGVVLTFIGLRYASEGDTLGMLVAVLNDNFWLATHVLTITIGYGAAFLAGMVAHVYQVLRCGGSEWQKMSKGVFSVSLSISFVALFFVVIGTILGGIWADQSWGRFWGWDPKENGALLIALWLLIVLHGRLAGYLKPLEYAAGLGLVNITVALAWFGVNLLSVGLHNYGFDDGVATGLFAYCGIEVLFTGIVYIIGKSKEQSLKTKSA